MNLVIPDYRPCRCTHLRPLECISCALIAREERYAHLRGDLPADVEPAGQEQALPIPAKFALPLCIHLGEATGEVVPCKSCNRTTPVPLRSCVMHGVCSEHKVVTLEGKPVVCCAICNDKQTKPPEPKLQLIPQIFHRIWVGDKPIPDQFERFWQTWHEQHPGWEFRTWTDANIAEFGPDCERLCREARNHVERADVLRFFIVAKYGGVYLDTDFACVKNIEPLLAGWELVSAWENETSIASGFFAAIPNHPVLVKLVAQLSVSSIDRTKNQMETAGPTVWTKAIDPKAAGVRLLPFHLFYSVPYTQRHNPDAKHHPDAYAVHWWSHLWEDDWATLTVLILGHDVAAFLRTRASITGLGSSDVVSDDPHEPLQTQHVLMVRAGDTFLPDGIKLIRHTLRHAPNYAKNDFAFVDDQGEWVRVNATVDRGGAIVRYKGLAVLKRVDH